jgi:two-component system CheB/CheR fusion protein
MKTKAKKEIVKEANVAISKVKKHPITGINDFPIVGIGASAGGLEALEQFFKNMPDKTGMAFVVIQHLDPNHVGIMPELLQRITPMKVHQATEGLKVKTNNVYVIPPNKSLSLLHGTLHLFEPIESRGLRLPIDVFFRSLADDMGEKSIAVILSGMGSDGSLGLKAIKEQNGVVLVQEPSTAKFDGMPSSACNSVIADVIAPADELAVKMIEFLKYIPVAKDDSLIDSKNHSSLDKIIILIREQSGHDFSSYKKNTLIRRIERRKGIHQIEKIQNYVRFLQENPKEVEILFKEILIGVTSFFRDPNVWEKLKESILPKLMEKLPNGYIMRAWVPACSTGEEAFTLAIIFKEAMEKVRKHKNLTLQIFATDLDNDAIEHARKGFFSSNIVADVSPERLSQFFSFTHNGYTVNPSIREMIVFANQNIIKDPPFTKLDILSCRNMLIYMEPDLQQKIMSLFNYSLNPGGILVLGTAETLGNLKEGFEELDSRLKIFKRTVTPVTPDLIDFPSSFYSKKKLNIEEKKVPKVTENIQTLADQILLQRFAPPSVLVNSSGDIIYITGRTGKYLEPVAGKANWNIHAMVRDELRNELPPAFRKALQNFDPVVLRNIKVGSNGGTQFVNVTVQRLESPDSIRGMIMIVFTDVPESPIQDLKILNNSKINTNIKIDELELELQRSYEDLQSTREEMQTSQEELKSTNEELQSTNEELQSTNEELTTSKEEMMSLNEEMQTVNAELQSKVSDYIRSNDDMKNLLNSTEIATLFLDKELNIRRFTDQATKVFKLRSMDIGRPFTDLVSDLQYPEMVAHARSVLKSLISIESSIATNDGRWFDVRILPYRTLDDHIDGLVITFTETTLAKRAEEAIAESEIRYRRLFETAKDGIIILDAETGMIVDVNPYLIDLLGYSREEFIEKAIWEIGLFRDIVANKEKFTELQETEFVRYEDLPLKTALGKKINVEFVSNVYLVNNSKVIQCNIRDITERKHAKEAMLASETRYRRLFESSKDGILVLDADTGKIVDVNPFLVELLGYSREEFVEKTIWEIGLFKDIVASKEKFLELQQKEFLRYEDLPLETEHGYKINVEFISNVYSVNNKKVIQCQIRDITERKKAESAILDAMKKTK